MFGPSTLTGDLEEVRVEGKPWRSEEVRQLVRFSLLGVVMGVVGAVSAWVLYHLIMIITGIAWFHILSGKTPLYPPAANLGFAAIIIPVGGGLVVGLMAKYGTDRIRGHGIPEAMEAVLKLKARVGPRIAIFKPISAAIAVGTGGPFGAEGPIIQTGGAIGSLLGQSMKMSAAERRILLACGGAAGMVGIFNTPIAGVAIAIELLLFEFRARSLVPVVIAAATAGGLRMVLLGSHFMFSIPSAPGIGGPLDLLWFIPLGVIVGLGAVVISKALTFVEETFDNSKISLIFKPALGALGLGIIAFFQPLVLGMGYTTITNILEGKFTTATLSGLSIGKAAALVLSLGSGTSGGLLAPMLLIGAGIGVTYGRGIHMLAPFAAINPTLCGIVAMSSLFSAAARAPLTSFIFAFELTGDYHAILPLMIGCMTADIVARALARESVMTERLVKRGLRVNQSYEPNILARLSVADAMTRGVNALGAWMPAKEALRVILGEPVAKTTLGAATVPADAEAIAASSARNERPVLTIARKTDTASSQGGPTVNPMDNSHTPEGDSIAPHILRSDLTQRWTFPVVDRDGNLVGVTTRGDLLAAGQDAEELTKPLGDLATKDVAVAYPDESLDDALMRLLAGDYGLLPVVKRGADRHVLGVLTRGDVLRARLAQEEDEHHRERYFWRRRGVVAVAPPQEAKDIAEREKRAQAVDPLASAEQSSLDLTAQPPSGPDQEGVDSSKNGKQPTEHDTRTDR